MEKIQCPECGKSVHLQISLFHPVTIAIYCDCHLWVSLSMPEGCSDAKWLGRYLRKCAIEAGMKML